MLCRGLIKTGAVPSAPLQGTAKFRIIGTVSGVDGIQYLYVKTVENNKLYKIVPDEIGEATALRYIFVIDGTEYEISKTKREIFMTRRMSLSVLFILHLF
jgi:hypothetical protein